MLDTLQAAATDDAAAQPAPLYMLQLMPDMPRLIRWAEAERLLNPRGEDDLGYAVHAMLKAAFAAFAPAPWALSQHPRRPAALRAYSTHGAAELREQAAAFADPQVCAALGVEEMAEKRMPARWGVGRRLGFIVRVRPTVRTKGGVAGGRERERDAFLAAIEGTEPESVDRGEVYQRWLQQQLAAAGVQIERLTLESFGRSVLMRRDAMRKLRAVEYPDASFSGVLRVTDPVAFAAMLVRGVGRHRAFGCGMLLLKPL
jgi:CRISPR system Cascade subunit CasE